MWPFSLSFSHTNLIYFSQLGQSLPPYDYCHPHSLLLQSFPEPHAELYLFVIQISSPYQHFCEVLPIIQCKEVAP